MQFLLKVRKHKGWKLAKTIKICLKDQAHNFKKKELKEIYPEKNKIKKWVKNLPLNRN